MFWGILAPIQVGAKLAPKVDLAGSTINPPACGLPATVPSAKSGCLWFSVCHQLLVSSKIIQNSVLCLRFSHRNHQQQIRMRVCFRLLFFVFSSYALSKYWIANVENHGKKRPWVVPGGLLKELWEPFWSSWRSSGS